MKKYMLIWLGLCLSLLAAAQYPLQVNDKVPPAFFKSLGKARMVSQLKITPGKPMIVFFCNTGCGNCIAALSTLIDLQGFYKGTVQFLMVSWQDVTTVAGFLEGKQFTKVGMAFITGDSILRRYFPFSINPHVVWIGRDSVVRAITGMDELITPHLDALVKNTRLALPVKKEIIGFEASRQPLLANGEEVSGRLRFSVALTGSVPGITGVLGFHTPARGKLKILATNQKTLALYARAWSGRLRLLPQDYNSRVLVEVRDSSVRQQLLDSSWCYELVLPYADRPASRQRALAYMARSLDDVFCVSSAVEPRQVSCYVYQLCDTAVVQPTGEQAYRDEGASVLLLNYDIVQLAAHFKAALPRLTLPFVYEGPATRITIRLRKSYAVVAELERDLELAGLKLQKTERSLDMLVIRER